MKNARFVLLLLPACLHLTSCNEKEVAFLRSNLEELTSELESSEEELDTVSGKRRQLESENYELESMTRRLSGLKRNEQATLEDYNLVTGYLDRVEAAITVQESALREWREQTVKSLGNIEIPSVTTSEGATLQNCKISEIRNSKIVLSHAGGSTEVPVTDLPASVQERLVDEDSVGTSAQIER